MLDRGVKLSMDGQGALRDNVFVERHWRSVKYERVYLGAYDSVTATRKDIAQYMDRYNEDRPYSSLNDRTPTEVWLVSLLPGVRQFGALILKKVHVFNSLSVS